MVKYLPQIAKAKANYQPLTFAMTAQRCRCRHAQKNPSLHRLQKSFRPSSLCRKHFMEFCPKIIFVSLFSGFLKHCTGWAIDTPVPYLLPPTFATTPTPTFVIFYLMLDPPPPPPPPRPQPW